MKRIFLAEDDPDDLLIFKEVLLEMDEEIIFEYAVNGQEALESLKSKSVLPDILFLDLNMPCMNGFEFMYTLKNDVLLSGIPIVIFTGSNNPEDAEKTHQLGANVFLSKPADIALLRDKLQRIINFDFSNTDQPGLVAQ